MSDGDLVARIGTIATKGKHKERFLFVGAIEPVSPQERFFYIIEIDTPWVDGEKIKDTIVRELIGTSQSQSSNSVDLFELAVKKINNNLAEIASSGDHEWIGKLNSIIGLISENEIIFSQTGNISGYLFRGNKISHITEKPVEKSELLPQKTFLSLINGEIAIGDRVVIANSKLYAHFSLDRLRQILLNFKYQDAINEIAKNLKKIKVRDVNLMVFEFETETDSKSDKKNLKPEIIILDEIPESKIIHYSKLIYKSTIIGTKKAGKGVKIVADWWQKNIQPKISKKITDFKTNRNNSVSERTKTTSHKSSDLPKINYFHNQGSNNIPRRISGFINNLLFWLKNLLKPENRRYLYVSLVVIFLLIGFIKIQINSRNNAGVKKQAESLESLNSARDLYAQAIDDLGLNREGGKEKLIQSRDLARKGIESQSIEEESKNLLIQIQNKLDELNLTTRIKAGSQANYTLPGEEPLIYAVGANIFSFSKNGEINMFDTRKKSTSIVASIGSSDGKIISVAYSDSANLFYLYSDSAKIFTLDLLTESISEQKIEDGESWEKAKSISIFSSNIYLLDSESGNIIKHTKNDNLYQKGTNYLSKKNQELVNSTSLAIDGDVYALTSTGKVIKIRRSAEDKNFAIVAPPTPEDTIKKPEKIFTDADTTTIFVLDKEENRVIQYSKTGQYKRQFTADKEINLTDFTVNEKMQKIWLLAGNDAYEIDI